MEDGGVGEGVWRVYIPEVRWVRRGVWRLPVAMVAMVVGSGRSSARGVGASRVCASIALLLRYTLPYSLPPILQGILMLCTNVCPLVLLKNLYKYKKKLCLNHFR